MTESTQIPLASLRELLDQDAALARWELDHDGVEGRVLLQPSATRIRFPMELETSRILSGRARLVPFDWRDGTGSARASIHAISRQQSIQLWSGVLGSSALLGHPEGLVIAVELPEDTTELILAVDQDVVVDGWSVGRVMWVNLMLQAQPATDSGSSGNLVELARPRERPVAGEGPLISVLTPVHNPPPAMLDQCVASVRNQIYDNWELCLVDDGSSDPDVKAALTQWATEDPRIQLHRHEHAQGIAAATNRALDMSSGDFVALLDHDDTLTEDALARIAGAIAAQPDLDVLYSDEVVVPENGTPVAVRKPDWSPEHLNALMYTCHVGVYRRALAEAIGGLNSDYDGCQDYDLILRVSEATDKIAHIPEVLYHWRAHANSTAGGDEAKPYAYLRQPGAIAAHLRRIGQEDAQIQYGEHPGMHRIVYRPDPEMDVAVIVSGGSLGRLELGTSGVAADRLNITVCEFGRLREAAQAAIDAGAQQLLLAYGDFTALTQGWLAQLLGYTTQPQIAAASPVMLAPDGRILHAGVVLPNGVPLPVHYGQPASAVSPVVQNLSALDGVVLMEADVYGELGGIDPEFETLGLIELTLRATDSGRRAVIVPEARLRSSSNAVSNDITLIEQLRTYHSRLHARDRYYNPHFSVDRADYVEPHRSAVSEWAEVVQSSGSIGSA